MLKLYESIPGTAILSLRTGRPIATIGSAIINPDNLHIEGWYVVDNISNQHLVLLSTDIREVVEEGFIVNDHEVLAEPKELIRLRKILDMQFALIGLKVTSEGGTKYGKIEDYAFEDSSMYIKKLYVVKPLVKSLQGGALSVDRSQIVGVTNRRVIIEDPTEKLDARESSPGVVG